MGKLNTLSTGLIAAALSFQAAAQIEPQKEMAIQKVLENTTPAACDAEAEKMFNSAIVGTFDGKDRTATLECTFEKGKQTTTISAGQTTFG
jgi:hypothetical protein